MSMTTVTLTEVKSIEVPRLALTGDHLCHRGERPAGPVVPDGQRMTAGFFPGRLSTGQLSHGASEDTITRARWRSWSRSALS